MKKLSFVLLITSAFGIVHAEERQTFEELLTFWEKIGKKDKGKRIFPRAVETAGYKDLKRAIVADDMLKLEVLLKNARVNKTGYQGITNLMLAAQLGRIKMVEALLKAGAKVNAAHEFGGTALMAAVGHGHLDTAKALIKADADIKAVTKDGTTALSLAKTDALKKLVTPK